MSALTAALEARLEAVRAQRQSAELHAAHLREQARAAERTLILLQGAESALAEVVALAQAQSQAEDKASAA
jgi:hypothetical protein